MKKILFTLLCLLILPVMFAQKTSEAFERGLNLFQNGKYEKALPFFEKDLAQQPKSGYSNFAAGACLIKMERYSEAIPYLDQAIKYMPKGERPLVYMQKASAYYNMEDNATALAVLNEAIKKYPKLPDLYITRASLYQAMEYYPSAMNDCDKALELDPTNGQAMFQKSQLLLDKGQYADALTWAERVLAQERNSAYLLFYISMVHCALEQYEEALDKFTNYLTYDEYYEESFEVMKILADTIPQQLFERLDAQAIKYPSSATWPYVALNACHYIDEYHRGISYAQKLHAIANDSTSYSYLLSTLMDADEDEKTLVLLKEAPQWGYSNEECLGMTFTALFNAARYDELLTLYDSLFPDPTLDTTFYQTPFSCYANTQQWQKALDWLERILPQRSDNEDFTVFYYNGIAKIKLLQHDTLAAQASARKAIEIDPDRIIAYYIIGDKEKAYQQLAKRYDFSSEDGDELYNLATCYAMMDDPVNALIYLRKAFEAGYYYGQGRGIANDYQLYNLLNMPEFKALLEEFAEKQKK